MALNAHCGSEDGERTRAVPSLPMVNRRSSVPFGLPSVSAAAATPPLRLTSSEPPLARTINVLPAGTEIGSSLEAVFCAPEITTGGRLV